MPALDDYVRHSAGPGIVVVGVSVDRPQARGAVEKIAAGLGYPIALTSDAEADGFGMPESLPVTYVIDAKGIVRLKLTPETGNLTKAVLESQVQSASPGTSLGTSIGRTLAKRRYSACAAKL